MFLHLPAGKCRNVESCNKKLCSYEHENINVNEEDIVDNSVHEEIEMTDEEKSFDLYIKVNFPDILSNYLENDRTIHCYYCSYKTKSKILRNIEDEVYKHLKTMHLEIFNAFKNDEIIFDNNWHEEFLGFFGSD